MIQMIKINQKIQIMKVVLKIKTRFFFCCYNINKNFVIEISY
jgi:hypothetical protein